MTAAPITSELTIASDRAEIPHVEDVIQFALQSLDYPIDDVCRIKIAVEEALINAITHGNQNDPAKRVHIAFTATTERFNIGIEDEGAGFNHKDEPDLTAPIGWEPPSGRGLLLMRGFMTEVTFYGRGNVVIMSKEREVVQ